MSSESSTDLIGVDEPLDCSVLECLGAVWNSDLCLFEVVSDRRLLTNL